MSELMDKIYILGPNLLTAMESLSLVDFNAHDPDIGKGLQLFLEHRQEDGLWECS